MPLSGPLHIPPIGEQTDPDKVRVAAVIGGQLASAPARGFGLTADELTALQDLTALASFGTGVIVTTVVTTSATYTKPAGLRYLEVTCVGGGGGSATVPSTVAANSSATGGAGGGGTAIKTYSASALAASVSYTVGALAAANGANGNASTFGTMTGGGGFGSSPIAGAGTTAYASGGAGGVASNGDINIPGGNGGSGVRVAHGVVGHAYMGDGGSSSLCPTFTGGYSAGAGPGANALYYGGGGRGGGNGASQAAQVGGQGYQGVIILKEFF